MPHFFKGDFKDVSDRQLNFVSKVLEELGFNDDNVTVENVCKAGDNYVASVKRIVVEKDGETFKMIAKVAPSHEAMRESMNTKILFHNESVMYSEVLPKYTGLEKVAKLPEDDRLRYATCYGILREPPNEIILLEDLSESNFFMKDRSASLTDDDIKLVLNNFAKLHALSYAFKFQEPHTYQKISNKLINAYAVMYQIPAMRTYMQSLEDDILNILEDEKYKTVVRGTVSQLMKFARKNMEIDKKSIYSIIQQGDSWTNNIMFRVNENKPVECCMIDYQVSRISSPVSDLHYMIFNCTDLETRSKYYHDWIDFYYKQLEKCLSKFGLKINVVYPRAQFETELKRFGKVSFCMSALLTTVLMRESSAAAKIMDMVLKQDNVEKAFELSKISAASKETILKFKNRLEGVIDSFLELGYL